MMGKIPPQIADQVVCYLGLFRSLGATPPRALAWNRAAKLLAELASPIADASVTRHGRLWPAPLEYWSAALEDVLAARDRLTLPLRSHGYLYQVVVAIAAKAEGRRESTSIAQARGATPIGYQGTPQIPPSSTTSTLPSSAMPRSVPSPEFLALVEERRKRGEWREE